MPLLPRVAAEAFACCRCRTGRRGRKGIGNVRHPTLSAESDARLAAQIMKVLCLSWKKRLTREALQKLLPAARRAQRGG